MAVFDGVEEGQLLQRISVDPTTLHQVLRELDQSQDVFTGDPARGFTHFSLLDEPHCRHDHDVYV